MGLALKAACGCHSGKIRRNNEDNFFFDGSCLVLEHGDLPQPMTMCRLSADGCMMAVFDGMGGENYGEAASFAAAQCLTQAPQYIENSPQEQMLQLCDRLNDAVLTAQRELLTAQMGTTMAALYFSSGYVYACNIGDSRIYSLKSGKMQMLSRDHVESRPRKPGQKPLLTQHLGIDPEEMRIEPHLVQEQYRSGDCYLLCSDGLTDMLTDAEIADILLKHSDPEACVAELTGAALERGGRDNITIIVCKIT